jgi:hypothetical protein
MACCVALLILAHDLYETHKMSQVNFLTWQSPTDEA